VAAKNALEANPPPVAFDAEFMRMQPPPGTDLWFLPQM
jgi:hypothetical protein